MHTLALVFNSAFSGAFLFIAIVIAPFWKSLSEPEILDWFSSFFWRFPTIMVPLNLLTFVSIAVGYVKHRKRKNGSGNLWLGTLVIIFLCSITYPLFFDGANKVLMGTSGSGTGIMNTLKNWELWHYTRTFLSLISLVLLVGIGFKKEAAQ